MGVINDLTGRQFGRLFVTEPAGVNSKRHSLWRVRCECGTEKIVRGSDLLTEKTRTCGADCKLKHQPHAAFRFRRTEIGAGGSQTDFHEV